MPRPPDPPSLQLSKTLAYLLRHGAQAHNLPIRADGYVPLSAVLAVPRVSKIQLPGPADAQADTCADRAPATSHAPTEADIRALVAADSKKRYELAEREDGGCLIRAVQGHSLQQVDAVEMTPLVADTLGAHLIATDADSAPAGVHVPRFVLLHGTTQPAWDAILATGGLLTMGRNHIHLAKGLPSDGQVISGMRSSSSVLVHVDPERVLSEGIPLLQAANGAILSPGKPYTPPATEREEHDAKPQPDTSDSLSAPQEQGAGPEPARKFPPRKKHPQGKKAQAAQRGQQGMLPLSCVAYVQLAKTGEVIWPPRS